MTEQFNNPFILKWNIDNNVFKKLVYLINSLFWYIIRIGSSCICDHLVLVFKPRKLKQRWIKITYSNCTPKLWEIWRAVISFYGPIDWINGRVLHLKQLWRQRVLCCCNKGPGKGKQKYSLIFELIALNITLNIWHRKNGPHPFFLNTCTGN